MNVQLTRSFLHFAPFEHGGRKPLLVTINKITILGLISPVNTTQQEEKRSKKEVQIRVGPQKLEAEEGYWPRTFRCGSCRLDASHRSQRSMHVCFLHEIFNTVRKCTINET